MNIQIHSKTLNLSSDQKTYLESKAEKILHYSARAHDESSSIRIHIEHEDLKDKAQQIHCVVNIAIPQDLLHAESYAQTVEAAIDICEEQLNRQVDKYKERMQK